MSFEQPGNFKMECELPILEREGLLKILEKKMEGKILPYQPNPKDFTDIYKKKDIEKDIAYVQYLENDWKQKLEKLPEWERLKEERIKRIATITEGIIINQFSGYWLNTKEVGDYNIIAHPTSKFDDYKVGSDVALEIINNKTKQNSHLGLSIDITYSSNTEIISSKIERILKEIKRNDQPTIKYFENSTETYRGPIDIARCVLVLSKDTVGNLFEKESCKDKKNELEKHPVQLSLLAQIEEQAQTFCKLSKDKGNKKMAGIYQEILNNINFLKKEKKEDFSEIQSNQTVLLEKYEGLKLLHNALLKHLLSS